MRPPVDRAIVRRRWSSIAAVSVVFFLCVLLVTVTRGTPAADAALLIIGAVLGGMLVVLAIAQARSTRLPAEPLAPPEGTPTWYAVADGSTTVAVYDSLGQQVSRGKMPISVGPTITSVYLTVFRDTITDMGYTPVGRPIEHHGACGCVEFEVTAARFPIRITDVDGAPVE